MLWTARVDSATSQKCSNLVLGIFSSLFMPQGIPQLRLSSENEHFLVGKPSKSHLKQPETHIWSLKSQILLLKNHKNHQKHVFYFLLFFDSMISEDSLEPPKVSKNAKICPTNLFFLRERRISQDPPTIINIHKNEQISKNSILCFEYFSVFLNVGGGRRVRRDPPFSQKTSQLNIFFAFLDTFGDSRESSDIIELKNNKT